MPTVCDVEMPPSPRSLNTNTNHLLPQRQPVYLSEFLTWKCCTISLHWHRPCSRPRSCTCSSRGVFWLKFCLRYLSPKWPIMCWVGR